MRNISQLVFHHSVTPDNWTNYYSHGKITYHWVIYKDGSSKRVYGDETVLWHAGNLIVNTKSIGIAFVGDYSTKKPSKKALAKACFLIVSYQKQYNIKKIRGHKDIKTTRCPGDWWSKGYNFVTNNCKKGITMSLIKSQKAAGAAKKITNRFCNKCWDKGIKNKTVDGWITWLEPRTKKIKDQVITLNKQVETLDKENIKLHKKSKLQDKQWDHLTLWERFQLLFK